MNLGEASMRTDDSSKSVASGPQATYQMLLLGGIGLDIINDNAKTHSNFSMEWARRTRRIVLSSETEADLQFHLRFESLCENYDHPKRRHQLHPNASFPPVREPRRRIYSSETAPVDRWGGSSDSEISYVHDDMDCAAEPPFQTSHNAPQRPSRRVSADADALSALIASMQSM